MSRQKERERWTRPEETRLWALVAATVRPLPGRRVVIPADTAPEPPAAPKTPPGDIEPGRKRRLTRERDMIELRLDLHGLDQDRARVVLQRFLLQAQAEGARAVLVITGKGFHGDGVLRRRAPEWLAEPPLRGVVAGVSEAHRRHGGEGALYVALKRRAD